MADGKRAVVLAIVVTAGLSACVAAENQLQTPSFASAASWDGQPQAAEWTRATLAALQSDGATLVSSVPDDIGDYCPAYARSAPTQRRAFWVGFLSKVAELESGGNPEATGGGGRFLGLMQISRATAEANGCATGAALLDGSANLSCAVRILAGHVARDGAVLGNQSRGWMGAARDWLPLRKASVQADLAAWTARQSYCR